jgi:hypothetical protein
MNASIRNVAGVLSVVIAFVCMTLHGASDATAQQEAGYLKKQIVGTWVLESAVATNADGSKFMPFGPTPSGMAVFDGNGRFVMLNMSATMPKFASNNRSTGTPEENKAIVTGSLGLFGTYAVNEVEKAVAWRIEACTFPNWVGQEQKRPINLLTADELRYTNPAPTVGGPSMLFVWKRVK